MTFETILYDVEDGILTITLNRPDRLNAFNNVMRDEVIAALDAADADDEVKAIIFTGSGRAFVPELTSAEEEIHLIISQKIPASPAMAADCSRYEFTSV